MVANAKFTCLQNKAEKALEKIQNVFTISTLESIELGGIKLQHD